MTTRVYHANTDTDRDFATTVYLKRGEELAEYVKSHLDSYELVAVPMRTETSLNAILEEAFRVTNSIDSAWYDNPESGNLVGGCRSTSVGDIVEFAGVKYLVDGCGFICLED